MSQGDEIVCFFDRPSGALAARQSLRGLGNEQRGLRLSSIAVVTRPALDRVLYEQDGDLGVWGGGRLGLLAGALAGAILIGPVAALVAVGNAIEPNVSVEAELGIAIGAALASALTALAAAVGGGLIGAIAAAVINLGISRRLLRAIGQDLDVGQAALVARVPPQARAAIGDDLRLRGGRLMRRAAAGREGAAGDREAARFLAETQALPDAQGRLYEPEPLAELPVDPRQLDVVVARFGDPAQARRARRRLKALGWRRAGPQVGNVALVSHSRQGKISFDQSENIGAARGALLGGVVGAVAGGATIGLFVMLTAMAAYVVERGDSLAPDELGVVMLTGLVIGLILGVVVVGGLGALTGGAAAGLINFAYVEDDLRSIGATAAQGESLVVALVHHHGAARAVEALEAAGGALQREPLSREALATAQLAAERERAVASSDPAAGDSRQLVTTRDGVRIFCDWRRRSPHTIVMLHGAGGDHLAWAVQYPALHAAGYSTLALDLRGHGYSDRPRDAEAYRLERFADDVYDVLTALGVGDFIIVGHCFGGMVTTMFHRAHPELSRGYILLDTSARAPALPRWLASNAPWALDFAGKALELLPDARHRLLHADMVSFKGTRDIEPLRLISDAQHTTLRSWLLVYRGIAKYDGVDALRTMHQPVWVAVGEQDTVFTVEDSRYIQQHVLGAKLVVVPEANHIIVVNNPEAVERIILAFIDEHRPFGERGQAPPDPRLPADAGTTAPAANSPAAS